MNIFETSYTEYLTAKKSGLRREAMTALNTFLAACGNVDTASNKSAGDDSATPLIPDETNKLTEQLAQLPDIPEKTQLTERLQRIMGKI